MPINQRLLVFQQSHLVLQLIPNLHAQLPLATNALAQSVELLVLLRKDARVVCVHLHIVHVRRGVAVARGRVRVVAVRLVEESGSIRIVVIAGGIVLEAHSFVRRAWAAQGARFLGCGGGGAVCMGKVLGEGWIVGVGECRGCARRGEAMELRRQIV